MQSEGSDQTAHMGSLIGDFALANISLDTIKYIEV